MPTPTTTNSRDGRPRVTLRGSWRADREALDEIGAYLMLDEVEPGDALPDWTPAHLRKLVNDRFQRTGEGVFSSAGDQLADAERYWPCDELENLKACARVLVGQSYAWE